MTKIEFPKKPIAFLVYFLKTLTVWQKWSLFLLTLCTFAVTVSHSVMMYGFQLLIDGLQTAKPDTIWDGLRFPFLIIVANAVFHTIVYRVRDVVDMYSTPFIQNSLREMLMSNVTCHSHDYFHNRFSGELVAKVTNIISIYRVLLWERWLNGFLPTATAIMASAVILWGVEPVLVYMLAVAVVLIFLCSVVMGKKLRESSKNLANREADISGQLVDTITNMASVKNYANHRLEISLLRNVQRPYIAAYKTLLGCQISFWAMFDVCISGMMLAMIWYLVHNWSVGQYSAGGVAVAILIAWDVWYRMAFLSWHMIQVSADFGKMSSALNDFVRPIGVEDKADAKTFTPQDGRIVLHDVSFVYDAGKKVFQKFNLTIPSAQRVGIVGLSGAGKTTLCQLLLRNYDVTEGAIVIGRQNIEDVSQESLRQKIAVIPQDPSLFHRSLLENIRYGRPDATEDEVVAAAKAAEAHDFIVATPEGYETLVGERGVKLSGGQRQRIAIARAILKNAPILILDEATSALDSDTERLIQTALDNAMAGRTTLVVAHRLSTLAHLDRIIVMKDGEIIEDGTLQELIEKNGHFAYLWNLQAGGFLPEKV